MSARIYKYMKLPDKIKGFNKIRDLEICRLWIDEGVTSETIAVKVGLTERRVRQILRTNKIFLKVDRDFEKAKRIHLIRGAIKNSKESKKDRADLIEQLRKEIEGNSPLVDNSKHTHFTTVIQQIHALESKEDGSNTPNRIASETLAE